MKKQLTKVNLNKKEKDVNWLILKNRKRS
jgi:hypothetical protein